MALACLSVRLGVSGPREAIEAARLATGGPESEAQARFVERLVR
jgi:hypothetical protein